MLRFMITMRSSNAKTGPIMVTTSDQQSCPPVCPLKNSGCYADAGPLRRLWNKLSETSPGDTFTNGPTGKIQVKTLSDLLVAISRQCGALWRHNQAGDLQHVAGRLDNDSLSAIAKANADAKARGWTYTHASVLGNSPMAAHNRGSISAANSMGFAVNMSGNNLHHADKLASLECGPVVAIVPSDVTADHKTPQGRTVRICPATQSDHVTCYNCGMCQIIDRDYIIAFPAHGTTVRKANAIAA